MKIHIEKESIQVREKSECSGEGGKKEEEVLEDGGKRQ